MLLRILVVLLLAAALVAGGWFTVHELYIRPEERLKADKSLPPPAPPPDPSLGEFDKCMETHKTRSPQETRAAFEQFLREFPSSTKRDTAYDILGEINAAEFFATKPGDGNSYIVKNGDALSKVAARSKISTELLVYLNRINSRYLHPNQRLLVPACSFRMVIRQKSQRIVLYNGDKFFRQYPAASWPGAERKDAIRPKQSGRVTEKRASDDGGSVTPAQLRYYDANHVILVSIPGRSLYTLPEDPKAPAQRPPGGGIGMEPRHASEISVLLPVGAPVSME